MKTTLWKDHTRKDHTRKDHTRKDHTRKDEKDQRGPAFIGPEPTLGLRA